VVERLILRAVLSDWTNFAVVVGAATASLLGLLFVAVSIRVETVARSAEVRNRSAQTMTLLLTGLLVAVLLAVPDQRKWALGAEYLVSALVVAAVAFTLDQRAGTRQGHAIGRLLGHEDGIYVVVPALIAVLVGGVVNAWLILVRLTG